MPKLFAQKSDGMPNKQPQLRVANSAYRKILLKRVLTILGYSVAGAFILYLCFAATIMRAVPTTSGAGIVAVKENTFRGGQIPSGVSILVDTQNEQKNGYVERLKQSFVPSKNAAVVQVVEGPYGSISWIASGLVTVDGELTDVHMSEQPQDEIGKAKDKLREEYLTVCVSGDCIPGEGLIVSQKNIYGLTLEKHGVANTETPIEGEK